MRSASYPLLALLLLTGCVDELVVGLRQPLAAEDAGPDQPLDASAGDDARTPEDSSLPDATPGTDASMPPGDASVGDAACGAPRCGEPSEGPCYSCEVILSIHPAETCQNGAPKACWDNGDGQCTMQCPDVDACKDNSECAATEFCFFPKRDCGQNGVGLGVCAPRPSECPALKNPACACDGQFYASPCDAQLVGQDIPDVLHEACK
jgi:hypothetical protein